MNKFTYHNLHPEQMWGCFEDGSFVAIFATSEEAAAYCDRHNAKNWTIDQILEREG